MPALVYPWTGCGLLPGPIKQWQARLLNLVESCINWTTCVHIYCPIISSYLLFEVSIDSAIYVRQLSKEAIFMNLKHSTCLHILLVLAIIYTIYPNHKLCVLLWGNGVTYCIFKKICWSELLFLTNLHAMQTLVIQGILFGYPSIFLSWVPKF